MLVRWTRPAVADFTHICDYTEERFEKAQARRAAITIYESVDTLRAMLNRGRPGRKTNTRELDVPKLPFVVIYRVREGVIEGNRILHGAQKRP